MDWTTLQAGSGAEALVLLVLQLFKLLAQVFIFFARTGWIGLGLCCMAGGVCWWLLRRTPPE